MDRIKVDVKVPEKIMEEVRESRRRMTELKKKHNEQITNAIKALHEDGKTNAEIAKILSVSERTVYTRLK